MAGIFAHIQDLSAHRGLIGHLVGRELKSRYRGSALGFLWTFLNPLLLLCVYALVFSVYMRIQMDDYAIFMFTGLLPWIWISTSLLDSTNAIAAGGSLVTKVMFPLQVLPAVKVVSALANYLLSLPILIIFLYAAGRPLGWPALYFPLVVLTALVFIWGAGLLLCTINVFFRDIQHILGNLLTLWFFVTPILYPISQVPEKYQHLVKLNPMAVIMIAFQDILFFKRPPDLRELAVVAAAGLVMVPIGMLVFDRYKENFAEMI